MCRQLIDETGLYHFRTVIPGNEFPVGWGPDDELHIHWDLLCENCRQTPFDGRSTHRFNKLYLDEPCTAQGCGNVFEEHRAARLSSTVWRYDIVL